MRMKTVLLIISLMMSVQAAASSSGIGVGVSPGNLSFELSPGTYAEQSLYVINTGNETATYNIFVDNCTCSGWFGFSPSSFDLRAGEVREVKVTLKVPTLAESGAECKIKIPCTAVGSDIGTGIIVPAHIEVLASEGNLSNNESSGSNSAGEGDNSSKSARSLEIKKIVQKFVENSSDIRFNFTQNTTSLSETLKGSGENLEAIAIENINNTVKNFNDTIKSFDDTFRDFDDIQEILDNIQKKLDNVTRTFEDAINNFNNATKKIDESSSFL
jgi:hypothetical protein